jgi:hypothetical protein
MVNITNEVNNVLNKSFVPYPNTQDNYFDMGIVQKESVLLVNKLLTELCELIKVKYDLNYSTIDLIKENYAY